MTALLINRTSPKLQKTMVSPPILLLAPFVGVAAAGLGLGVAVAPSSIRLDRKLSVGIETLLVRAAVPEKEMGLVSMKSAGSK